MNSKIYILTATQIANHIWADDIDGLTAIANSGNNSVEFFDGKDWSSFGDGEQPEWFKGSAWYSQIGDSDMEHQGSQLDAVLSILGHDTQSCLCFVGSEAAKSAAQKGIAGHRGVEFTNLLRKELENE